MKCPHCSVEFHPSFEKTRIIHNHKRTEFVVDCGYCPSPNCSKPILFLRTVSDLDVTLELRLILPLGANRGPVPIEVPKSIAQDYIEACNVLPISPKASAALSRRVLQAVLHAHHYKDKNLNLEIDQLLNEADPKRALPQSLRDTIDGIRNFGNFSAHPITDKTSLQIIDVEPEEAEWCLEVVEELFEHFYVRPAKAKRKKDALDAKLISAGKPLAK